MASNHVNIKLEKDADLNASSASSTSASSLSPKSLDKSGGERGRRHIPEVRFKIRMPPKWVCRRHGMERLKMTVLWGGDEADVVYYSVEEFLKTNASPGETSRPRRRPASSPPGEEIDISGGDGGGETPQPGPSPTQSSSPKQTPTVGGHSDEDTEMADVSVEEFLNPAPPGEENGISGGDGGGEPPQPGSPAQSTSKETPTVGHSDEDDKEMGDMSFEEFLRIHGLSPARPLVGEEGGINGGESPQPGPSPGPAQLSPKQTPAGHSDEDDKMDDISEYFLNPAALGEENGISGDGGDPPQPSPAQPTPRQSPRGHSDKKDIKDKDTKKKDTKGKDTKGKYIKDKDIKDKDIKDKDIKGKNIKGKDIKGKDIKDKDNPRPKNLSPTPPLTPLRRSLRPHRLPRYRLLSEEKETTEAVARDNFIMNEQGIISPLRRSVRSKIRPRRHQSLSPVLNKKRIPPAKSSPKQLRSHATFAKGNKNKKKSTTPSMVLKKEKLEPATTQAKKRIFQCRSCRKRFACQSYLTQHLLTHKKKAAAAAGKNKKFVPLNNNNNRQRMFKCSYVGCGKVFTQSHVLYRHIRIIHMKLRPYSCPTCGKKFSTLGNMATHYNGIHLGILHFCQCGKSYKHGTSLRLHQQRYH